MKTFDDKIIPTGGIDLSGPHVDFPPPLATVVQDLAAEIVRATLSEAAILAVANAAIPLAQKAAANGVATLGSDSLIPNAQLPPLSLTTPFVVASQAAQLALDTQLGDFVIRTDQGKTWVRNSGTTGTMADFTEILSIGDIVSVNGYSSGVIVLTPSDVGADVSGAAAAAQAAAIAASAQGLIATGVKTSSYTAAARDLVPVNISGGSVPIPLPSAPPDNTRIGIKVVAVDGSHVNTCTITRGGSDVFNIAGGSTSLTLSALFQGVLLQYKASTGIWYVTTADTPLNTPLGAAKLGTDGTVGGTGGSSLNSSIARVGSLPVVDLITGYGLVGNGSDETTALFAAFDDAKTNGHALGCSKVGAVFGFSGQYTFDSEVSFIGPGTSAANLDNDASLSARSLCVFKCLNSSAQFYFHNASRALTGMTWTGCAVDGAGVATNPLVLDYVQSSIFDMRVSGGTAKTLTITTSLNAVAGAAKNTSKNQFRFIVDNRVSGAIGYSVTGSPDGTSNVCHNDFPLITVWHAGGGAGTYSPSSASGDPASTYPAAAGVPAIEWLNADSNTRGHTYVALGTTAALAVGSGGSYSEYKGGRCRANVAEHVEFGNGCYVEAQFDASVAGDSIYNYNRENGQPLPTLATGARLMWIESGRNSSGAHFDGLLRARQFALQRSPQTLGSGVFTLDASSANIFTLTLTADVTLTAINNPPNTAIGNDRAQPLVIELVQDGTGGRKITWPSTVVFRGATAPVLPTAPNARTSYIFYYNGTDAKWYEQGSAAALRQTGWVTKSAAYTLLNTDSGATVTATATITLPINPDPSRRYGVKNFAQNITVTVSTGGANVIDSGGPTNATSMTITANGESVDFALAPNGTDWIIV